LLVIRQSLFGKYSCMKAFLKQIFLNKDRQLAVVLVLFYLSEAITKITYDLHSSFHNYSALIKGAFCVFAICYALDNLTLFRKKIFLFLIGLSVCFVFGQYVFNDYTFGKDFPMNFVFFVRYMFVFVILLFLSENFRKMDKKYTYSVFEKVIVFNSVLIVVGFFFDIDLFQTYSVRFGYNGLFMAPSISTFFYALALTYYSNSYILRKEGFFPLMLVIVTCLLVGTKALMLFLALTIIHLGIVKKWYKKRLFYSIIILGLVGCLVFKDRLISRLSNTFETIVGVFNEYGFLTAVTSFRNIKLEQNFLPLINEKWALINYLVGGTNFVKYRVEFEVFDIFLFFGIVGSFVYLFFYFKHVMIFRNLTRFGGLQMTFLLVTALMSGTFFNNAPVVLYLWIVLGSIQNNNIKMIENEV